MKRLLIAGVLVAHFAAAAFGAAEIIFISAPSEACSNQPFDGSFSSPRSNPGFWATLFVYGRSARLTCGVFCACAFAGWFQLWAEAVATMHAQAAEIAATERDEFIFRSGVVRFCTFGCVDRADYTTKAGSLLYFRASGQPTKSGTEWT